MNKTTPEEMGNGIFCKKTIYNKDIMEAIHLLAQQIQEIINVQSASLEKIKLNRKMIFALYGLFGTIFAGLIVIFLTT